MRTATAGIAVAAMLGLGGCTDEAAPEVAPSASPGAEETSSAHEGPGSPSRFVNEWVNAYNYGAATGETEELRALSLASCITCQSLADLISDLYARGGRVVSPGWSVHEVTSVMRESGSAAVDFRLRQPAAYRIERPGGPRIPFSARITPYRAELVTRNGRWMMKNLGPRL